MRKNFLIIILLLAISISALAIPVEVYEYKEGIHLDTYVTRDLVFIYEGVDNSNSVTYSEMIVISPLDEKEDTYTHKSDAMFNMMPSREEMSYIETIDIDPDKKLSASSPFVLNYYYNRNKDLKGYLIEIGAIDPTTLHNINDRRTVVTITVDEKESDKIFKRGINAINSVIANRHEFINPFRLVGKVSYEVLTFIPNKTMDLITGIDDAYSNPEDIITNGYKVYKHKPIDGKVLIEIYPGGNESPGQNRATKMLDHYLHTGVLKYPHRMYDAQKTIDKSFEYLYKKPYTLPEL